MVCYGVLSRVVLTTCYVTYMLRIPSWHPILAMCYLLYHLLCAAILMVCCEVLWRAGVTT